MEPSHADLPSEDHLRYWGAFSVLATFAGTIGVWLWRQTFIGTAGRWVGRSMYHFLVAPIMRQLDQSINETLVERVRAGLAPDLNDIRQGNDAIIELIQQQDVRIEAVRLELIERLKRRRRNDPAEADS